MAFQAPLSMGFSRREHWSGLPVPSLGDLPNPEIKPESRMSPALAGGFSTTSTTWKLSEVRELSYLWYTKSLSPSYKYCVFISVSR